MRSINMRCSVRMTDGSTYRETGGRAIMRSGGSRVERRLELARPRVAAAVRERESHAPHLSVRAGALDHERHVLERRRGGHGGGGKHRDLAWSALLDACRAHARIGLPTRRIREYLHD